VRMKRRKGFVPKSNLLFQSCFNTQHISGAHLTHLGVRGPIQINRVELCMYVLPLTSINSLVFMFLCSYCHWLHTDMRVDTCRGSSQAFYLYFLYKKIKVHGDYVIVNNDTVNSSSK
jgi:hypothetical protein